MKMRNTETVPYYKASKLWDTLPRNKADTGSLVELKNC